MDKLSLFHILIIQLFVANARGSCYYPDGTDRNAGIYPPLYTPCDAEGGIGMCCGSWDLCRGDGLCQTSNSTIWRESCSMPIGSLADRKLLTWFLLGDPNWRSLSCLNLCIDGIGMLCGLLYSWTTSQIVTSFDSNCR